MIKNPSPLERNKTRRTSSSSFCGRKSLLEDVEAKLDWDTVNKIKSNANAWHQFRKQGKALYELVNALQAI